MLMNRSSSLKQMMASRSTSVLVTGAAGMVGGEVVRQLSEYPGVEIRAVDVKPMIFGTFL